MLKKTNYFVPEELLNQITLTSDFKTPINEPTGRFFYDRWKIKDEYKGTVWEQIYDTLPDNIGEARIINLDQTTCYQAHADIDDRYHLNLSGEECYLIDLTENKTHKLVKDGQWYEMDAGRLHSAANLGRVLRTQLVVRKLLVDTKLTDPIKVKLTSVSYGKDDARFLFDNTLSPWLNRANKLNLISGFEFGSGQVIFYIERSCLPELRGMMIDGFKMEEL